MNAKAPKEPAQPHPDPAPTAERKRSSPTPSPEFAQARLRRDLRILTERKLKAERKHEESMAKFKADTERLVKELAAVDEKLKVAGG